MTSGTKIEIHSHIADTVTPLRTHIRTHTHQIPCSALDSGRKVGNDEQTAMPMQRGEMGEKRGGKKGVGGGIFKSRKSGGG